MKRYKFALLLSLFTFSLVGLSVACSDDPEPKKSQLLGAEKPPSNGEDIGLVTCYPLPDNPSGGCDTSQVCVKALGAGEADGGICTIQCGAPTSCDGLDTENEDWVCTNNVTGASAACVPNGWLEVNAAGITCAEACRELIGCSYRQVDECVDACELHANRADILECFDEDRTCQRWRDCHIVYEGPPSVCVMQCDDRFGRTTSCWETDTRLGCERTEDDECTTLETEFIQECDCDDYEANRCR